MDIPEVPKELRNRNRIVNLIGVILICSTFDFIDFCPWYKAFVLVLTGE